MRKIFTLAILAAVAFGAQAQTTTDRVIDICKKNTSNDYADYGVATGIATGRSLTVRTSRYTDFYPVLTGRGTLNVYSGGERTYFGKHSDKSYPDWSKFMGDVHIHPYKEVEGNCGFYGVIMNTNGKSYSPEDVNPENKINGMLAINHVTLHEGATLATEKSAAGVRIGELNTEEGSQMMGYYKSQSATSTAHYLLGALNTDATLAGRISSTGEDTKQAVGIIKEGTGTYTITGNTNTISGALRVKEGAVMVCNDAAAAKSKKLSGGTGCAADKTMPVAYVFSQGVLGGTGNVGGHVDLYGTLRPGCEGSGTLTIANYTFTSGCNLIVHPGASIVCSIASAEKFTSLDINGKIVRNSMGEDFTESSASSKVVVELAEDHDVKVGDTFTLLKAKKGREEAGLWFFRIVLPEKLTWKVNEETGDDGSYTISVTCTSLSDNGESGDKGDEDIKDGDDDDTDFSNADVSSVTDKLPLRRYIEMLDGTDKRIGVAIPSWWRIDIPGNPSSREAQAISSNFNLCVAENEMKMDALEPVQNSFDWTRAQAVLSFARSQNMDARGHTLVWHQQVPEWISVDGKKNDKGWTRQQLLSILKNHVTKCAKTLNTTLGLVEWDVVNETLDDDQSIVRTNPKGYKLREESVWVKVIGEDFIDSAFVWAHEANPNAKLYLNDYGVEYSGSAKATALFNLATRLKNSGIPIYGVGLQCHLHAGDFDKAALNATVKKYEAAGLDCLFTEVDMAIYNNTSADLAQQAQAYKEITEVFMARPNCKRMVLWGITDNHSWIADRLPLLFDSNVNPKPAYDAVRQAMRRYVAAVKTDIVQVKSSESMVVDTRWFTIDGRALSHPQEGICVERTTLSDGTVKVQKVIKR